MAASLTSSVALLRAAAVCFGHYRRQVTEVWEEEEPSLYSRHTKAVLSGSKIMDISSWLPRVSTAPLGCPRMFAVAEATHLGVSIHLCSSNP